MIVVDSSAIISILKNEIDSQRYAQIMYAAGKSFLSVGNYLEISMVADIRDPVNERELDTLLKKCGIRIEPISLKQGEIARAAWRDFGRGSNHAAQLNYGDCFAYALAKDKDMPLLYKGDDFGHTDVRSALD